MGFEHLTPRRSISIPRTGLQADTRSTRRQAAISATRYLVCQDSSVLDKVSIAHFDGVCSTDTIVIRPTEPMIEGFLLFTVFSDTFVELANVASKGTKMPRGGLGLSKKAGNSCARPRAAYGTSSQIRRPLFTNRQLAWPERTAYDTARSCPTETNLRKAVCRRSRRPIYAQHERRRHPVIPRPCRGRA